MTTICFFQWNIVRCMVIREICSENMKRIHACNVRIPRPSKETQSLEHSFGNLSSLHLQLRVHCKTTAHTVVRCCKYCAVYHDLPWSTSTGIDMTLNLGQVQFPQIPKSSFWELCEVGAMQSTPLFAAVQDGTFRGSHIAIHQWSAQHGSTQYPLVSNQTLMEVTCECRSFDFDIFSPCTHIYMYILYIYMYMTLVVAMPCLGPLFFGEST